MLNRARKIPAFICATISCVFFVACQRKATEPSSGEATLVKNLQLPEDWRADDLFEVRGLKNVRLVLDSEFTTVAPRLAKRVVHYDYCGLEFLVDVSRDSKWNALNFSLLSSGFHRLLPMEIPSWYEAAADTEKDDSHVFVKQMKDGRYLKIFFPALDSEKRKLALQFRDALAFD